MKSKVEIRERITELKREIRATNNLQEIALLRRRLHYYEKKLSEVKETVCDSRYYMIKTKFVFEGKFKIKAKSREEAIEVVKKCCGMSFGVIEANSPKVRDWFFLLKPNKIVK